MWNFFLPVVAIIGCCSAALRFPRSIDLSAAQSLKQDTQFPGKITPNNYTIDLRPNLDEFTFTGKIKIVLTCQEPTDRISLYAAHELEVNEATVRLSKIGMDATIHQDSKEDNSQKEISIRRVDRDLKRPILEILLHNTTMQGTVAELEIEFSGQIWEISEGMFKGSYLDNGIKKVYIATHMRPNNARRLFPCFDEPAFKVPFTVSISRPKNFHTLFNTPVNSSEDIGNDYALDHFETTPSMSTFTFGFVISQLKNVERSDFQDPKNTKICIKVYGRPEVHKDLDNARVYERIEKSLLSIQLYFGVDFPLKKLDVVALPSFLSVKPVDNWGLIVYKESELLQNSYYLIAQELVYQWLGAWATPFSYNETHINKAFASFIAAKTAIELDGGAEFEGKWPMTILYSLYYEFSKRYPHSVITGMKQESICSKTELVLRMLNFTLGADTFRKGLQKFFIDHQYKTFSAGDIWESLTKQAQFDNKLCHNASIEPIVNSWIHKDRIPTVKVTRNYDKKTAKLSQKVYLRERPHDVVEKDKLLWYIPIVMVTQDTLDFSNASPTTWMKQVRDVELTSLPAADKFIIVNPEEIGPFPVNYDEQNWNLLAEFLLTSHGRQSIPVFTRAKLLHDAWNLAYAGKLNFASAFNMTLFMKSERDHLVWNPVFTMIDHIGRHIDMSSVHKKFETYVRTLLTPLYEELGPDGDSSEENWKRNLRSLSKTFLCRAGYKPCIEDAQGQYKKWMESEAPDEGNPVANQYICPVFEWGTMDEWEFGLQRIINFPTSRKQSERTYLLKTLAGCPNQHNKILRLLNITILEENLNFTESDIISIFNMLSGNSIGYSTLLNFLQDNWDIIKIKFVNKTNLWEKLINTATGAFKTQEGYDMVKKLKDQHKGEFGSAEHLIDSSLKNIKEEAKWSSENLPVIEKWLDNFSSQINNAEKNKFMG